jgi:hypothetical protein
LIGKSQNEKKEAAADTAKDAANLDEKKSLEEVRDEMNDKDKDKDRDKDKDAHDF